jgi:hypothetical protein
MAMAAWLEVGMAVVEREVEFEAMLGVALSITVVLSILMG